MTEHKTETGETGADFIRALLGAWDCCATCAGGVLLRHDRQVAAQAWYAGYEKGNLDGYFGTGDERAKSPYADLDPYRDDARTPPGE